MLRYITKDCDFSITGRFSVLPSQLAQFDEESCHMGEVHMEWPPANSQQGTEALVSPGTILQELNAAKN